MIIQVDNLDRKITIKSKLDKTVYDYLREFEREGVIEGKRDNNKYRDIRLTK